MYLKKNDKKLSGRLELLDSIYIQAMLYIYSVYIQVLSETSDILQMSLLKLWARLYVQGGQSFKRSRTNCKKSYAHKVHTNYAIFQNERLSNKNVKKKKQR